jgi:hypothetical protein
VSRAPAEGVDRLFRGLLDEDVDGDGLVLGHERDISITSLFRGLFRGGNTLPLAVEYKKKKKEHCDVDQGMNLLDWTGDTAPSVVSACGILSPSPERRKMCPDGARRTDRMVDAVLFNLHQRGPCLVLVEAQEQQDGRILPAHRATPSHVLSLK